MTYHLELGRKAEQFAKTYLLAKFPECKILQENFRCRQGEIDLIFEENVKPGRFELVFVEVRARRLGGVQTGIESVGYGKRLRLTRAARFYLHRHYRGSAGSMRFDVLDWDGFGFQHFKNIRI